MLFSPMAKLLKANVEFSEHFKHIEMQYAKLASLCNDVVRINIVNVPYPT